MAGHPTKWICRPGPDGHAVFIPVTPANPSAPIGVVVHQDSMDPLVNHANGRIYDSKSEFRKATRAAGCIEVGNEVQPQSRQEVRDNSLDHDLRTVLQDYGISS